jgi:osmotically-inducible protein OsmY
MSEFLPARKLFTLYRIYGFILIAASMGVVSSALCVSAQTDPAASNHGEVAAGHDLDDAATTTKVKEALASDKKTSGAFSAIHVLVSRGVVTLTGDVTSQATAEQAQQVASQVTGVRDVVNDLKYPHMSDSNPSVIPPASSTER